MDFFHKFFFEISKEISKYHEIILITDTSDAKDNACENLEVLGIKIYHLEKRQKFTAIFKNFGYLIKLRRKINQHSPENIYFLTLEISMFGALISRFIYVKKIFFLITGLGPFFLENKLKEKLFRLINKSAYLFLLFKNNYKFLFQNEDDMNIFCNQNISSKTNSILLNKGLGINTNKFPFIERNKRNELTFVFAARLVKSKGFNEFLNAGKILLNRHPNIKIIVAGKLDFNNPESISEETFNELKQSRIEYLGEIHPNKMNDFYSKGTIFVLPSYREGFAQGALEAASTGMPLILTDVPGCRECVLDNCNGFLIEAKNLNDLISKMSKFILKPELISPMSISSRKMIEKNFTVKSIAQDYLSHL